MTTNRRETQAGGRVVKRALAPPPASTLSFGVALASLLAASTALCPIQALAQSSAPAAAPTSTPPTIQEVVVTAQKRSEKLRDVPIAIGVVTGQSLEARGATSLLDVAGMVPGLTVENGGSPGQNGIIIRGLATGYNNSFNAPLVATYIDDSPVGGSAGGFAGARGGMFSLDLMPYDIEQVEILRGPQGTLYGADAMGGLVKYSLNLPSLTRTEFLAGGGVSYTDNSSSPSYDLRVSGNQPIIPGELAIRASAYYSDTAGYIDNIGTGVKDSNHAETTGGRASILWRPMPTLKVEATALVQNIHSYDDTAVSVNPTTGKPEYGRYTVYAKAPEPFIQQGSDFALRINWDLGFGVLTSASSYSYQRNNLTLDISGFSYEPPYPNAINPYQFVASVKKYTEETRLASPSDQRIQWMVGVFYTREEPNEFEHWYAYSSPGVLLPAPYDILLLGQNPGSANVFTETAGFANTTIKLTKKLDVSGGVRYSSNDSAGCDHGDVGLYGSGGVYSCTSRPTQDVTTWMANARYHLNAASMVYVRAATGYRPGGGCTTCGNSALDIPGIYQPDHLIDYEGGLKGEYLEHKLTVDLSAYYIDWTDIQLQVVNSLGLNYAGNGGKAVSKGVEATTSYRFGNGLAIGLNLARNNAHLTQNAPGVGGKDGDPLPGAPKWIASTTADYTHPLRDGWTLIAGGAFRYRSMVYNNFRSSAAPVPMGPQDILDAYIGVEIDRYTVRLYGKNLNNDRSYTGLLFASDKIPRLVPVQPLTIGLSLDYKY